MIYLKNGTYQTTKYPSIEFHIDETIGRKDLESTIDLLYREIPSSSIDFLPTCCGINDESSITIHKQDLQFEDLCISPIFSIQDTIVSYNCSELIQIHSVGFGEDNFDLKYVYRVEQEVDLIAQIVTDDLKVQNSPTKGVICEIEIMYNLKLPLNHTSFDGARCKIADQVDNNFFGFVSIGL
ncbi:MAG: hypothetical protein ACRCXZ_00560 [Patescibacteria group bacterium]